jgi:hypothetical protein
MPVWVFDEAHAFQQSGVTQQGDEPSWISQLLAEFVRFRTELPDEEIMPMCVVASTQWSATHLKHTGPGAASIVDLQMLPLSNQQCYRVFVDICSRISTAADSSSESSADTGATQHAGLPDSWPYIAAMLATQEGIPDLPCTTQSVLQLAAGNPRLLAYAISAMADSTPVFSAGRSWC